MEPLAGVGGIVRDDLTLPLLILLAPPERALPARSLQHAARGAEATALARVVYGVTARLPAAERPTLGDQLAAPAVSVYANVAEGHGRATRRDALRCYAIAAGSLQELDAHLGFCAAAGLAPPALLADARRRVVWVRKLLDGLRRATASEPGAPPPAPKPPSHRP
jgi:four helix bundle protein